MSKKKKSKIFKKSNFFFFFFFFIRMFHLVEKSFLLLFCIIYKWSTVRTASHASSSRAILCSEIERASPKPIIPYAWGYSSRTRPRPWRWCQTTHPTSSHWNNTLRYYLPRRTYNFSKKLDLFDFFFYNYYWWTLVRFVY
jgi:hypothetical protein